MSSAHLPAFQQELQGKRHLINISEHLINIYELSWWGL